MNQQLTGRKGRMVKSDKGIEYVSRNKSESETKTKTNKDMVNMTEKDVSVV